MTAATPVEPGKPTARGLFLSLDGPDGGGKTTQAALLVEWLRARGLEVVACRDPGGTPLGGLLRQVLLDRATSHMGVRAEMLLFMASRAQLVEEVIRPALDAGKVVVADRYLLANLVYQGFAGGLPLEEIALIGRTAIGGLFPDLTLVLDVDPQAARARIGGGRDRIEDRSEAYSARVREGFLTLARQGKSRIYSAPIAIIDASADSDTVRARIQSEVERALALGPRS